MVGHRQIEGPITVEIAARHAMRRAPNRKMLSCSERPRRRTKGDGNKVIIRDSPDGSGALYGWSPGRCCLTLGLREEAYWKRLRPLCDIGYPNACTASLYDLDKDVVQQRAIRRVEVEKSRKPCRFVLLMGTDFVLGNSRPGEEITHTRLAAFEVEVTY